MLGFKPENFAAFIDCFVLVKKLVASMRCALFRRKYVKNSGFKTKFECEKKKSISLLLWHLQ
jgi:hypothetical protein